MHRCPPTPHPLHRTDYGHSPRRANVDPSRVSRIGALLQGLGCAPGTSRFLPSFGSEPESRAPPGRRGQPPRSRMPVMRGLLAPQNTFLETIATRFDGTREYRGGGSKVVPADFILRDTEGVCAQGWASLLASLRCFFS